MIQPHIAYSYKHLRACTPHAVAALWGTRATQDTFNDHVSFELVRQLPCHRLPALATSFFSAAHARKPFRVFHIAAAKRAGPDK